MSSHPGDLSTPPLLLSSRLPSRPTALPTGTELCKRALVDLFIGRSRWDLFYFIFSFFFFFFSSYLGISRRLLALLLVYSCRLSSFIKNSVSGAGRGGSVQGAKSAGCSGIVLPPSCQVGLLLASPLGARKASRKRRRDKERGRRWRSVLEK